jgi:hypothetical protein
MLRISSFHHMSRLRWRDGPSVLARVFRKVRKDFVSKFQRLTGALSNDYALGETAGSFGSVFDGTK